MTTQHDATSILVEAADTITERGQQRDKPQGERSMAATVAAFNAIYGTQLTELQGWQFMALLKIARSSGKVLRIDDHVDQAAYAALAGECAIRTQAEQQHAADRAKAAADAHDEVQRLLDRRSQQSNGGHAL